MTNTIKHAALFDGHVTLREYILDKMIIECREKCFSIHNAIKEALKPYYGYIENAKEIHKGKYLWRDDCGMTYVTDIHEHPPFHAEIVGHIDEGTDIDMEVVSRCVIKDAIKFDVFVDGKKRQMIMYATEWTLIGDIYHSKMMVMG